MTTAVYLKPKKEFVHTVFLLFFYLGVAGFFWWGSYITTTQALTPMLLPLLGNERVGLTCFAINVSFTILESDLWFPLKGKDVAAVCWVGCIADFGINLIGVWPWLAYLDRSGIPQAIFAVFCGVIPFGFIVAFTQFAFGVMLAVVLSMGPEWSLRKAFE